MLFPFSKYEGTGNDFILIDDRNGSFPCTLLISLNFAIVGMEFGADGFILVCPSKKADFSMRIF